MGMLGTVMVATRPAGFHRPDRRRARSRQTASRRPRLPNPTCRCARFVTWRRGASLSSALNWRRSTSQTDTVSAQRALEIHCDELLVAKNGVDATTMTDKNPDARRFDTLTSEALRRDLKGDRWLGAGAVPARMV